MSATVTTLADRPTFAGKVGLLAGGGQFPFCFIEAAKKLGMKVVCVGIKGHADKELRDVSDKFYWTGLARLGRMIKLFRKEGIDCVVSAGKIHRTAMFSPSRLFYMLPDFRTAKMWLFKKRRDNQDDALMLAIIDEFKKDGIRFASALEVCPELLVKEGTLTSRKPTANEERDIAFGWRLAKEMGRLDVGQSVVVKDRVVLAVEAIEGTDQAILRGGQLCSGGGFVVVKVAKPKQDVRFDVPAFGAQTIDSIRKAGGRVLAIEADKTILLGAEETVRLANQYGISIVSIRQEQAAQWEKAA